MTADSAQKSIVVVVGPTAAGKSELAMQLAYALDGELVSADSVQVYRGFDIGSAKPSLAEQAAVPHHLIDIRNADENYSAADFMRDAGRAIDDIVARGKMPIVCGGTGLYVRSLLYGLAKAAPADAVVRALVEAKIAADGLATVHAGLTTIDPVAGARIHPNDRIRIIRALEIYALTGRTASSWHDEHQLAERPYRYASIALSAPRPELHRRIGARTRTMIDAGLLDEVRQLLADGAQDSAAPFTAIGYREALQVVRGQLPEEALFETLSASTRQYARRQLVWLRGQLEDLRWFESAHLRDSVAPIATALEAWRAGAEFGAGYSAEPGAKVA